MADELRHAPWLTLSLVLHALVVVLLVLLFHTTAPEQRRSVTLTVTASAEELADPGARYAEVDAPTAEDLEPLELDTRVLSETTPFEDEPQPRGVLGTRPDRSASERASASDWATPLTVGGGTAGEAGIDGRLTPAFRQRIRGLRESGLDIVFVFDSTASMGAVLDAAKRQMLRMVEVLRVLVPQARIGVVTFRDTGRDEEYLTRSVPLAQTAFRAINFVHTIRAWGGGDEPEAVLEGLYDAFRMPWRSGARRVVVLIGDAPPHDRTVGNLRRAVRRFAKDGLGHVHAVATGHPQSLSAETVGSFRTIAEVGDGEFAFLESQDAVLEQILTLAFGSRFRTNLADVYERVTTRGHGIPTRILDIVRRDDADAARSYLLAGDEIDALARAVAQRPSPRIAELMIELLFEGACDEETEHAIAWALAEMLDVREVPLDPETGKLRHETLRTMRYRVREMERED